MTDFTINFLDHVAIRVKNIEQSVKWYQNVLGLEHCKTKKWGDFPVLMLSGKSGIALFPAHQNALDKSNLTSHAKIDHFAFNVDQKNFNLALKKFKRLNIEFHVEDHTYFHSVYIKDLDNYTVELTTLIVDEKSFYK